MQSVYSTAPADWAGYLLRLALSATQASGFLVYLPFLRRHRSQNQAVLLLLRSSLGGACGVMVIVVGNEHGDTISNPGRD